MRIRALARSLLAAVLVPPTPALLPDRGRALDRLGTGPVMVPGS